MQVKFLVRKLNIIWALLILSACANPSATISGGSEVGYISGNGTANFLKIDQRVKAPDLASVDFEGKQINLNNYKNKVVVINVWGSWCSPCRKEATELEEMYKKNFDQGVEFIGINIRDSKVSATKYIKNFGITYPNIYDRDGKLILGFKNSLPANSIPTTVLIDKNGKVAARQLGPIDRALLQGFISVLVEE